MTQQQLQREIKFRAWMEQHKVMQVIFDSTTQESWFLPNIQLPIMQYTGLKDSAGNEIYEGDIVRYESVCVGDPNKDMVGVVSYLEAQFSIVNEKEERAVPLFTETATITVVGNIYEHPKLLKLYGY